MAFPTSPTNGQLATINSIEYVYSSATNSWTSVPTSVKDTLIKVNSAYDTANAALASAVALSIALG